MLARVGILSALVVFVLGAPVWACLVAEPPASAGDRDHFRVGQEAVEDGGGAGYIAEELAVIGTQLGPARGCEVPVISARKTNPP